MGCFLACFGSSKNKDRKRRRKHKVLPGDQRHGSCDLPKPTPSLNQESKEASISLISEQRDKPEEQLSISARKKVTFDPNVKTYEHVPEPEGTNFASENEEEKERGKEEEKTRESLSVFENDSVTSSLGSYPPNHRYQNCRDSDDEDGGIESDGSDLDDDDEEDDDEDFDDEDVEPTEFKEESSESFFSLPVESGTQTCASPPNEKEVNSSMQIRGSPEQELKTTLPLNQNARDRSKYVHSVLNPVENLSQWKAVKARPRAATPPLKNQKENNFEEEPQIPFSPEPTFKRSPLKSNQSFSISGPAKEEISVDASLSNWLVSTETKPNTQSSLFTFANESTEKSRSQRSNSPISPDDRPILGALTVEELKQFSASTSPRKSPSRSPDEIPIIGTVGSYWSHTGQATDSSSGSSCKGGIPNTTSKYREDKRVNWHSTPFERRLERALNRGSAEAFASKF